MDLNYQTDTDLVMYRDRRLTGFLRGQTDNAAAPAGFELNNPWRVLSSSAMIEVFTSWPTLTARETIQIDDWAFCCTYMGRDRRSEIKRGIQSNINELPKTNAQTLGLFIWLVTHGSFHAFCQRPLWLQQNSRCLCRSWIMEPCSYCIRTSLVWGFDWQDYLVVHYGKTSEEHLVVQQSEYGLDRPIFYFPGMLHKRILNSERRFHFLLNENNHVCTLWASIVHYERPSAHQSPTQ